MAVAVSMINMKGGVGKTTVASQLAHAVTADGLRVLAVDLDPQSNLSQSLLGARRYVEHIEDNRPTVAQVLDDYIPSGRGRSAPKPMDFQSVLVKVPSYPTSKTFDLIPSRLELSRTLKNPTGKERRLAKGIAQVRDRYDIIIIDCAPTESILTEAAYFASRYVVVPVKTEFMATIGLPLLARSVEEFSAENQDHELDIAGLVLNEQSEYADNSEKSRAIKDVKKVSRERGWHMFDYTIPYSRSYTTAARQATSLSHTPYARRNRIDGFHGLKDEILQAIGVKAKDR